MVQLLLKTKLLHSDAKNIEEKSALDITTNEESISILVRTKAEVINPWPVSDLRTFMSHIKGDITEPTQCLSGNCCSCYNRHISFSTESPWWTLSG